MTTPVVIKVFKICPEKMKFLEILTQPIQIFLVGGEAGEKKIVILHSDEMG